MLPVSIARRKSGNERRSFSLPLVYETPSQDDLAGGLAHIFSLPVYIKLVSLSMLAGSFFTPSMVLSELNQPFVILPRFSGVKAYTPILATS